MCALSKPHETCLKPKDSKGSQKESLKDSEKFKNSLWASKVIHLFAIVFK